jgi:hypothetical protein
MTIEEAQANIGKPFKCIDGGNGLAGKFDTIKKVVNGWIYGEFMAAPAEDCRLKQEQPEHLKQL